MHSPGNREREERLHAGALESTSLAQVLFALLQGSEDGTLLIYGTDDALYAAVKIDVGYPTAALAEDAGGEHNLATLLLPIFGWAEGRFEFVEAQDLVGEHAVLRGRLDPLPLIAAAARGCTREKEIERNIGLVDRHLIQKSRSVDPNRYAFSPHERLVLSAIEPGLVELDEVRKLARVPENVLRRVIHVLLVTGGIALLPKQRMVSGTLRRSAPPRPHDEVTSPRASMPVPTPSRPVPVPASAPPSPPAVSSRATPSAPMPKVTPPASRRPTAYSQHARPSSIPAPIPTDPRARREQSEALWRKAETLANRGELENALQAAKAAGKLYEPRPEDDAMLGWIILQHGNGDESVHEHVRRCVDRAMKRDPLCEQVLYYKGLVLNLLGDIEQAHAHFQRVLLVKPDHAGATREVRIYEMRKEHARNESSFLRRLLTSRPKPE